MCIWDADVSARMRGSRVSSWRSLILFTHIILMSHDYMCALTITELNLIAIMNLKVQGKIISLTLFWGLWVRKFCFNFLILFYCYMTRDWQNNYLLCKSCLINRCSDIKINKQKISMRLSTEFIWLKLWNSLNFRV